MRTADQVKRKYNELAARKQALDAKRSGAAGETEQAQLQTLAERLDEQMLLLEWVLNEPLGSYHG
ncbi:hypothetical protein [Cohnella nanjingensis]|uniref:Uncharacterized protein n=1 Tax=Cohnella nanjingensis TaxID=1387779 RepID=A0A7X0VIS1_9BACL|nr:hypothetical protein [Cohnella nanjingensis]MBB6675502.1 hypothetical protein [Cohnella nanjingensis]